MLGLSQLRRSKEGDAIVSFAGPAQRRRLFLGLDLLTVKWATGRFLLNTQLMFLKKEKDPTSKQSDGDEWIRSALTGIGAETYKCWPHAWSHRKFRLVNRGRQGQ